MARWTWLVVALALGACGHVEDDEAKVRVLNALVPYDAIDLFVDDRPQVEDLEYSGLTPYIRLGVRGSGGGGGGGGGGGDGSTTTSSTTSTMVDTFIAEPSREDATATTTTTSSTVVEGVGAEQDEETTTTTTTTTVSTTTTTTTTTLGSGIRTVQVFVDSVVTRIIEQRVTFVEDQKYTLYVYGGRTALDEPRIVIQQETKQKTVKGKLRFRLANMAPTAGVVDLYVVEAGTSILNRSPVFTGIGRATVSAFFDATPGSLEVKLTRTLSKDVVYDSGPIDFVAGEVQTMIVIDKPDGGVPLQHILVAD